MNHDFSNLNHRTVSYYRRYTYFLLEIPLFLCVEHSRALFSHNPHNTPEPGAVVAASGEGGARHPGSQSSRLSRNISI